VPKTLHDRTHVCPACGLILGRDHNAALNVLARSSFGAGTALRTPSQRIAA
jgi:transposase